jgi:hypothetical protein
MDIKNTNNREVVKAILSLTHKTRVSLADIDYAINEVIDPQVFDYDISIDEAKGYYEQAKVNLTEIKNLIDSLMI